MSFPLAGNERLAAAVDSFIRARRMPHALLIEGDEGLGRHTLASYLAAAAVCTGEEPPCGTCRNCHLAAVGTHPDISVTAPADGKKNITVDQVRALRQQMYIQPHMAARRVFIIDRADTMNEQAQNALLKVLEEPPADAVLLLIVRSRTVLLETILSRCIVLTLSPPRREQARAYLCGQTKNDGDAVDRALDESGNNIGRALEILSEREKSETETAAAELLRLTFSGSAYEMLRLLSPFEKDRVQTDELFAAFREQIARELRRSYTQPSRAKMLEQLYRMADDAAARLKTNINLSLLFSAVTCEAKRIVRQG